VQERAVERLGNLYSDGRMRVVGQALVLAVQEGELRLQKQLRTRNLSGSQPFFQCRAHPGLEVMLALIGRVDPTEPRSKGEPRERLCLLILPRRAIQERGGRRGTRC